MLKEADLLCQAGMPSIIKCVHSMLHMLDHVQELWMHISHHHRHMCADSMMKIWPRRQSVYFAMPPAMYAKSGHGHQCGTHPFCIGSVMKPQ